MQRHITLGLLISLATAFVIGHIYFNLQLIESTTSGASVAKPTLKKPDFKAIPAGRERKAAFFAYLTPFIEAENQKIASLRSKIAKGNMKPAELEQLAKRYRIKTTDTKAIEQQLLKKADVIPPSLVLTQAAIESAWGTSRFAVKGNNYFGQWCFKKGCGLVPNQRIEGKNHEVRVFKSPQDSVSAYVLNLNSHPAYKELRQARAQLAQQGAAPSGCYLATGLESYSEKGMAYVNTLKKMIRSNRLEQDPSGHCKPIQVATPQPEPETTDVANQDSAPETGDVTREAASSSEDGIVPST